MLTCTTGTGVCATCYGRSMATGKLVDIGEAVGIVAAQSIGEPGTQLTMRTFHQGGVAGDDITGGLPRVQELFEARVPKGKAPIADVTGRVQLEDGDRFYKITIVPDDGGEEVVYDKLSKRQRLRVFKHDDGSERLLADGDHVEVGQQLMEGAADPHEVLRVMGPRQVQIHLVNEVQEVYRSQGVSIHDKHIEIIVRQMLRRVTIIDSGATEFLPGSLTERAEFEAANRRVVAEGGEPAAGRPVLMGITKASLATDSWLSAASFQETTRVLTDAAINCRSDKLIGLKENVIIGKLIPAGTGINRYRNIQVQPTEEARAAAYAVPSYDDQYYSPDGFGQAPVLRFRWTTTVSARLPLSASCACETARPQQWVRGPFRRLLLEGHSPASVRATTTEDSMAGKGIDRSKAQSALEVVRENPGDLVGRRCACDRDLRGGLVAARLRRCADPGDRARRGRGGERSSSADPLEQVHTGASRTCPNPVGGTGQRGYPLILCDFARNSRVLSQEQVLVLEEADSGVRDHPALLQRR